MRVLNKSFKTLERIFFDQNFSSDSTSSLGLWKGLIILLGSLLLFTGCHKKVRPIDENRQLLRLNIHTEPPTLDARKATDTSSISIIQMCFEGLMRRVPGGAPQLALANRVKISEDLQTYTFYLRSANWSDGTPITAHDFERSWKTILSPDFGSGFANDLYVLKNARKAKIGECPVEEIGVSAKGPLKLVVQLDHPVPYFLDLVASHSFLAVPTHIVEAEKRWADNSGPHFVGNGAYRLKEWRHHNHMVLERNGEYWDHAAVRLEEIHLTIIEDETTELHMFESGELDWAGSPLSTLPTDALQALADQDRLNTYPISGTYYYIFNVRTPPFDNLNLRRAFTYAINRKEIIDNITQSKQQVATSFVPPAIWEIATPVFEDNAIEKAREHFNLALEEMGYTKATFPPITLIYNKSAAHHKIAQAIQEQWFQAFGLRVRLQNVEWKVFLDELAHGQFQIARMGGVASFQDPLTFLDQFRYESSRTNFSGWTNEQFSSLLDQAEQTTHPDKREQLLRQAEGLFIEELPIAPIYYYTGTYIKKRYVKGIELSELSDADFKFAFLEAQ
ncbi:MAG: Oligopeptide-binding protein OppA [Chlamydiae bacterium]|nr:Oligopeptide-binding protein OppA [Chlamydiota bacterium]